MENEIKEVCFYCKKEYIPLSENDRCKSVFNGGYWHRPNEYDINLMIITRNMSIFNRV